MDNHSRVEPSPEEKRREYQRKRRRKYRQTLEYKEAYRQRELRRRAKRKRLANGGTQFHGKVCRKHPKLKGLRNLRGLCVECMREYRRKYQQTPKRKKYLRKRRQTPEYKEYRREYQRDRRRKEKRAASSGKSLRAPLRRGRRKRARDN